MSEAEAPGIAVVGSAAQPTLSAGSGIPTPALADVDSLVTASSANKRTVIVGRNVVLVPYLARYVEKYHAWMEDPEIRELTASERLTLEEEYEMQRAWQRDNTKHTFIIVLRDELQHEGKEAREAGAAGAEAKEAEEDSLDGYRLVLRDGSAEGATGEGEEAATAQRLACAALRSARHAVGDVNVFLHDFLQDADEAIGDSAGAGGVSWAEEGEEDPDAALIARLSLQPQPLPNLVYAPATDVEATGVTARSGEGAKASAALATAPAGACSLPVSPTLSREPRQQRTGELEIMVADPRARRRGAASEALALMIAHARERLGVSRFVAKVTAGNGTQAERRTRNTPAFCTPHPSLTSLLSRLSLALQRPRWRSSRTGWASAARAWLRVSTRCTWPGSTQLRCSCPSPSSASPSLTGPPGRARVESVGHGMPLGIHAFTDCNSSITFPIPLTLRLWLGQAQLAPPPPARLPQRPRPRRRRRRRCLGPQLR